MQEKSYAWVWTVIIIVILAGSAYWYSSRKGEEAISDQNGSSFTDPKTYVSEKISELSPVKEALGGKFYVTSIQDKDGKGTVQYEDGHNAYTADFTYETKASGEISITSFKIRR